MAPDGENGALPGAINLPFTAILARQWNRFPIKRSVKFVTLVG